MNYKNVVIRPFQDSDKLTLLHLMDLNTPKYFAETERSDFENYLENEIELYYIISFEDKIIGCGGINFEENKKIGIISWDMIHPNYHGKSFGKQLLEFRLSELSSFQNTEKVIVRTSQITYLFYEKQGFHLQEIIPNYWAEGFDLYFMEMKIN